MPQKNSPCAERLVPEPRLPEAVVEQQQRLRSMMDGTPQSEAAVAEALEGMNDLLEMTAARLYNLASMLVGEGEESIELIEKAVASTEVSICQDAEEARVLSLLALCRGAVRKLEERNPGSLAAPATVGHAVTCLDDDDLESAGFNGDDLSRILSGPDREHVRNWLEGLATLPRTVFVLRAVGGICNPNTAKLLNEATEPASDRWTPEAVSALFRQGLCSLASQLVQSTATR